MIATILETSVGIAAYLILIIGCLVTICLLLYPIWFLLNNVLYRRTKAAIYFGYYLNHRKSFIKWFEENKPNVYTPKIKK